jgi:glycosyltransferase involved in cell wall biosynthesis
MKVAAVSMVYNEADVIEYVAEHMLAECDQVIVADNRSTDGTKSRLERMASHRLIVVEERSFAYLQAKTMNWLGDVARELGAAWVVPFDADEWWDSGEGRIADVLKALPLDVVVTGAHSYDMIPQPDDPPDTNPFARIHKTRPGSFYSNPDFRKCAYRPRPGRTLLQGNHGLEGQPLPEFGPLRIRHYPYRTFEQAREKLRHGREAALASGLGPGYGAHWLEWGGYSDDDLLAWWQRWTDPEGLTEWSP